MKLSMRLITVSLLMLFLPSVTYAEDSNNNAQQFINLYLKTCMNNIINLNNLRSELIRQNASRLPDTAARFFLQNHPGMAWRTPDTVGDYVISIRNDGICATFARHAQNNEVQTLFTSLVSNPPARLSVSAIKKQATSSNTANGPIHTIEYWWTQRNSNQAMQFKLTTSSSENSTIQAMATTAVIANH